MQFIINYLKFIDSNLLEIILLVTFVLGTFVGICTSKLKLISVVFLVAMIVIVLMFVLAFIFQYVLNKYDAKKKGE